MSQQKSMGITVNLANEGRLLTMKTILGYEAAMRGLTIGQTFAEMVLEAVDIESYPDEVRTQLAEIEERRNWHAAMRSLDAAELDKIA